MGFSAPYRTSKPDTSRLRKLLCLIGWHDCRFKLHGGCAYTVDPRNAGRAANAMWECQHCDYYYWHWYRWALDSARENGGSY